MFIEGAVSDSKMSKFDSALDSLVEAGRKEEFVDKSEVRLGEGALEEPEERSIVVGSD